MAKNKKNNQWPSNTLESERCISDKYHLLIELSPSIIYLLDQLGNFAFLGGQFKEITGFELSEFKGKPFSSLVWEEDLDKLTWSFPLTEAIDHSIQYTQLRLRTRGREKYKYFVLGYSRVDLDLFGLSKDLIGDTGGKSIGIYGVGIDVTEGEVSSDLPRKATEILLREGDRYKKLCHKLIDWVEDERRRFAEIGIERVCQGLMSIRMELEALHRKLDPAQQEIKQRFNLVAERIARQIGQIRSMLDITTPSYLNSFGIVPAIARLAERAKREKGFEIFFFAKDVPEKIQHNIQWTLYRIAEEAITNATRHADGKELFINIVGMGKNIVLTVEDDGKGFDPKEVEFSVSRLGLFLMRELAHKVGGEFSIDAKPAQGTQIWVEIPV